MSDDGEQPPTVEFFYCASCPWTYLAFLRVQEAALRTHARIVWRPIVAQWVHQVGNRTFPDSRIDPNPRKAAYGVKDLQDWARFCGIEITQPDPWPIIPIYTQRGAIVAERHGALVPYATAAFRAHFVQGLNIAELDVVRSFAIEAGLADGAFVDQLLADEVLAELRRNGDELVTRGGFGSPTMFIGDDLYFGNDRMPLVELALMHRDSLRVMAPGAHSQE
jgi:2-hydroxychromene-2-carboxylate isomerase